jgi:hypothetical protein
MLSLPGSSALLSASLCNCACQCLAARPHPHPSMPAPLPNPAVPTTWTPVPAPLATRAKGSTCGSSPITPWPSGRGSYASLPVTSRAASSASLGVCPRSLAAVPGIGKAGKCQSLHAETCRPGIGHTPACPSRPGLPAQRRWGPARGPSQPGLARQASVKLCTLRLAVRVWVVRQLAHHIKGSQLSIAGDLHESLATMPGEAGRQAGRQARVAQCVKRHIGMAGRAVMTAGVQWHTAKHQAWQSLHDLLAEAERSSVHRL